MKTKILASVIVLFHTILSFGQVPGLVSGNLNITAFPTALGGGKFQVSGTFSDPTGRWFAADVDTGMIMWKGNDLFKIDSIILQSGSSLTFRVVDTYSVGFIATGNAQVLELSPNLKIPGVAPTGDSNSALTPAPDHASLMNYILRTMDERVGRAAKQDTIIFVTNNTEGNLSALGDLLGGRNAVTVVVTRGASAVGVILPPVTPALRFTKFIVQVYANPNTGTVGMFDNDAGFVNTWNGTNYVPVLGLLQLYDRDRTTFWPVLEGSTYYWAYARDVPNTDHYRFPAVGPIQGVNRKNVMVWTNGLPSFSRRYATDSITSSVLIESPGSYINWYVATNNYGFFHSVFPPGLGQAEMYVQALGTPGNLYNSLANIRTNAKTGVSSNLVIQSVRSVGGSSPIVSAKYDATGTAARLSGSFLINIDSTNTSAVSNIVKPRILTALSMKSDSTLSSAGRMHYSGLFRNNSAIPTISSGSFRYRATNGEYAVKTSWYVTTANVANYYDWFRISGLDGDTTLNNITFYNNKYAIPNASPGLGSKVIQWNNGTPSFAEVKRDTTVSYNNLDYNLLTVGLTSAQVKNRYNNIIVTGYVPSSSVTSDALFFLPPPSADYNQVTIWLNALDENATYGIGISAGVNDVMVGDGTYSNQYPPGALTPGQTLRIRCQMDPKDSNNYKWILN